MDEFIGRDCPSRLQSAHTSANLFPFRFMEPSLCFPTASLMFQFTILVGCLRKRGFRSTFSMWVFSIHLHCLFSFWNWSLPPDLQQVYVASSMFDNCFKSTSLVIGPWTFTISLLGPVVPFSTSYDRDSRVGFWEVKEWQETFKTVNLPLTICIFHLYSLSLFFPLHLLGHRLWVESKSVRELSSARDHLSNQRACPCSIFKHSSHSQQQLLQTLVFVPPFM